MANIGYATLSVIPSLRGMDSAMRSQLSGVMPQVGRIAGDQAGGGFMSSFTRGIGNVASSIGSVLYGAAQGAGLAAGGVFAAAVGKGMGRLVAIDNAEAQLRGLGHTAEGIEAIMQNALDSVLGTAFGLDEAAGIAGRFVAAGIEPGEELERTLRLVGDAAAIAGTGLNEMGDVFAIIQGGGRAMTRELQRLEQRNIPIFQWLAAEFGTTTENMRTMVTNGVVDAERFKKVIEDNIGGAALAMGDSFTGSLRNMGAALGRLGARFLRPFFGEAQGAFVGMTELIDDATAGLGEFMDRVEDSAGFQRFRDIMSDLPGFFRPIIDRLADLGPRVLAPLGAALAAFATQGVRALLGPFGALIPAINPIVAALVALAVVTPEVRELFKRLASAVGEVIDGFRRADGPLSGFYVFGAQIRDIWEAVKDLFAGPVKTAVSDLKEVFGPLVDDLKEMAGIGEIGSPFHWLDDVPGAIEAFGKDGLPGLTEALKENDEEARAATVGLGGFLTALLGIRAISGIVGLLKGAGGAMSGAVASIGGPAALIVAGLAAVSAAVWYLWNNSEGFRAGVSSAWERIQEAIQPVVDFVLNTAWPGIQTAWRGISTAAGVLWESVTTVWNNIMQTVGTVVGWLQTHVGPPIAAVFGFIGSVLGLLFDVWSTVWGLMWQVLEPIIGFIWGRIQKFLEWVAPIWEEVWGFISDFVSEIFGSVVTFIEGALADITTFFENATSIVDTVRVIFSKVAEWISTKIDEGIGFVEAMPGRITGFFSDAGSLLFGIGEDIIQGLWDGMKNVWNKATGWISSIGGWIQANKGPASKDRRLLIPAGQWIFEGLHKGMQAEWANTERWLRSLSPQIASSVGTVELPVGVTGFDDLAVRDMFQPTGGTGRVGDVTVNNHIYNPTAEPSDDSLASITLGHAVQMAVRKR